MSTVGFWRRKRIKRRYPKRRIRYSRQDWERLIWSFHPLVLMLAIALTVSAGGIQTLEHRMRPVLSTVAKTQVEFAVTALVEENIAANLAQWPLTYGEIVTIQRNEKGDITALSTDVAQMNQFRHRLVEQLLLELEGLDTKAIRIPIGSLTDSELLWGRGPSIKVHAFMAETVTAEFESEFSGAGVNQTLHKIWLSLCIPVKILLPGTQMETEVNTRVCIAETVIVGQVPNYLQKAIQ